MKELILKELQQSHDLLTAFMADENNIKAIQNAADIMINCIKNGGKIIACGNGGSMCDAMHFASELTGRYRADRKPLPAIAISDPAHLTCVGNDYGYPTVFSRYVEAHGNKGDVLLAISTSGRSSNVSVGVTSAILKKMNIVFLTGNNRDNDIFNKLDIGRFDVDSDAAVMVPHSGSADRIQEIHIKVIHILVMLIEKGVL